MVMRHVIGTRKIKPSHRSDGPFVAGRARLRDQVTARVRSRELDLELASGAPTESTPAIALRARRLTGLGDRRAKAATLRRLLRDAGQGPRSSRVKVPPSPGVVAAADALTQLAEALALPGPVAARGAAEASLLLTDGTGPLYNPATTASLEFRTRMALEDLAVDAA